MPNGGAPFNNEDLNDVFQTEPWGVLQGMLSGYDSGAEGVIVSGCVVTANASNFDMTAGIVYLNGEFMRVDAVTNLSYPRYIKAATPTNVTRTFENTTSQIFIIEKKAQVSATVDGSGQEITISNLTNSIERRLERLKVSRAGDTMTGNLTIPNSSASGHAINQGQLFDGVVLKTKVIQIGDWNMDNDVTVVLAHGLADYKKIRSLSAVIRDDSDVGYHNIARTNIDGTNSLQGMVRGINLANTAQIVVSRATSGFFDSTDFDATSYNRGWVTIVYEV